MGEITTIGVDIAKHVFPLHGIDANGEVVLCRRLSRKTPRQIAQENLSKPAIALEIERRRGAIAKRLEIMRRT